MYLHDDKPTTLKGFFFSLLRTIEGESRAFVSKWRHSDELKPSMHAPIQKRADPPFHHLNKVGPFNCWLHL